MKKIIEKYPILRSSANPEQISLAIKSIGAWLIVGAIAIARTQGVDLAEADLIVIVNNIAVMTGAVMTIVGLGRKIYNKFKN